MSDEGTGGRGAPISASASGEPGLWSLIASDVRRKQKHYVLVDRFFNKYVKIALQLGTIAVVAYRFGHWAFTRRQAWVRVPACLLHAVLAWPVRWASGIDIAPRTPIGPGFVIHNFANITIDAESIGAGFTVNQGVSVGADWTRGRRPRIGDNVFVGSGARVLGDIDVGHQVVVAANALVSRSLADRCMVAGVPGFVVSRDVPADYVAQVAAHAR